MAYNRLHVLLFFWSFANSSSALCRLKYQNFVRFSCNTKPYSSSQPPPAPTFSHILLSERSARKRSLPPTDNFFVPKNARMKSDVVEGLVENVGHMRIPKHFAIGNRVLCRRRDTFSIRDGGVDYLVVRAEDVLLRTRGWSDGDRPPAVLAAAGSADANARVFTGSNAECVNGGVLIRPIPVKDSMGPEKHLIFAPLLPGASASGVLSGEVVSCDALHALPGDSGYLDDGGVVLRPGDRVHYYMRSRDTGAKEGAAEGEEGVTVLVLGDGEEYHHVAAEHLSSVVLAVSRSNAEGQARNT